MDLIHENEGKKHPHNGDLTSESRNYLNLAGTCMSTSICVYVCVCVCVCMYMAMMSLKNYFARW